MDRRKLLKSAAIGSALMPFPVNAISSVINNNQKMDIKPLAITMWDFSWLERRWPGAGYEDCDKALDELIERGYNSIRIDVYPHLIANDPEKEYTLYPVWDQQVWGSPDVNKVVVQPNLNIFLSKCKDRKIMVGLSSWFREDSDNVRMKITSADKMAEIWQKTLESIPEDLKNTILYVDLCNEWPGDIWAPYFKNDPPENTWTYWHTDKSMKYMKDSILQLKKLYPEIPFCYSFTGGEPNLYTEKDLSFFDLMEHHVWMAQLNGGEYYNEVGYDYGRFDSQAYKNLVANYKKVYNKQPNYWKELLITEINLIAQSCKKANLPLITTECWALVDFKDWPLLSWDIVKQLCETGVQTAAATGQWAAIATSNFAGPQFVGMWRDIEWHKKQTNLIKNSPINPELQENLLLKRMR
ncbi:MAG: cellulase [Mariniphaga sp.]|nr:cellulase [Mariniphaga sp.]